MLCTIEVQIRNNIFPVLGEADFLLTYIRWKLVLMAIRVLVFDVILAFCAINMWGFEYVFQPFKQELSKKTEDNVHLEIVKNR